MSRALVLAATVAACAVLAPAAAAHAGRVAIGLAEGASADAVGTAVAGATGGSVVGDLGPLDAIVVSVPDVQAAVAAVSGLAGVAYAEPVEKRRRLAFTPTDPLLAQQWYVPAVRAFDFWPQPPQPPAEPILVGVVDSGIDASHHEFDGRVDAGRSFVDSDWTVDTIGHGTMTAGEIAAGLDNGIGIAGIAFPARLLIAKVVGRDGSIQNLAEARGIRWVADRGARVINLSLGGTPFGSESRGLFSPLEEAAIEYATRKGALVVAAVGNCTFCPHRFATYPAALPHVLGVSALRRNGAPAAFSNTDEVYNDIAAPGQGIVSTFPVDLTDPGCANPGYSSCAVDREYREGAGTSFSAPIVSAAAALVLAQNPSLGPSQVAAILERSAVDVAPAGRDAASGWGRLDVPAALAAAAPPDDRYEPNEDVGDRAHTVWGRSRTLRATLDYYDDPVDVYRIKLAKGQRLTLTLRAPRGARTGLALWKPGTSSVDDVTPRNLRQRALRSRRPAAHQRLVYRVPKKGWYAVEVRAEAPLSGAYRLVISKRT